MEIHKYNVEQGKNGEIFQEPEIPCIGAKQFFFRKKIHDYCLKYCY